MAAVSLIISHENSEYFKSCYQPCMGPTQHTSRVHHQYFKSFPHLIIANKYSLKNQYHWKGRECDHYASSKCPRQYEEHGAPWKKYSAFTCIRYTPFIRIEIVKQFQNYPSFLGKPSISKLCQDWFMDLLMGNNTPLKLQNSRPVYDCLYKPCHLGFLIFAAETILRNMKSSKLQMEKEKVHRRGSNARRNLTVGCFRYFSKDLLLLWALTFNRFCTLESCRTGVQ